MPEPSAQSGLERCRARPVDIAACRRILRRNSKTFHAASLLLPRALRDPACVIYGFCRLADDIVDVEGGRHDAIEHLRERLDQAYQGRPLASPTDRALASVVAQYRIPQSVPALLLEGLQWDAQGRQYETLEDLFDYATRVAGTVGVMMALLMGARSTPALARACELGVAMQLTNIARDVGEDARLGRIYLPLQWMREVGIDPQAWLAAPVFSRALGDLTCRLLEHARQLYDGVDPGVALLPLRCRPGINAARLLYAQIGDEIARAGYDSVSRRAVVPGRRKLLRLAQAVLHLWPYDERVARAPLPATRELILSAADARSASGQRGYYDRLVDVILLFERIERNARHGRDRRDGRTGSRVTARVPQAPA